MSAKVSSDSSILVSLTVGDSQYLVRPSLFSSKYPDSLLARIFNPSKLSLLKTGTLKIDRSEIGHRDAPEALANVAPELLAKWRGVMFKYVVEFYETGRWEVSIGDFWAVLHPPSLSSSSSSSSSSSLTPRSAAPSKTSQSARKLALLTILQTLESESRFYNLYPSMFPAFGPRNWSVKRSSPDVSDDASSSGASSRGGSVPATPREGGGEGGGAVSGARPIVRAFRGKAVVKASVEGGERGKVGGGKTPKQLGLKVKSKDGGKALGRKGGGILEKVAKRNATMREDEGGENDDNDERANDQEDEQEDEQEDDQLEAQVGEDVDDDDNLQPRQQSQFEEDESQSIGDDFGGGEQVDSSDDAVDVSVEHVVGSGPAAAREKGLGRLVVISPTKGARTSPRAGEWDGANDDERADPFDDLALDDQDYDDLLSQSLGSDEEDDSSSSSPRGAAPEALSDVLLSVASAAVDSVEVDFLLGPNRGAGGRHQETPRDSSPAPSPPPTPPRKAKTRGASNNEKKTAVAVEPAVLTSSALASAHSSNGGAPALPPPRNGWRPSEAAPSSSSSVSPDRSSLRPSAEPLNSVVAPTLQPRNTKPTPSPPPRRDFASEPAAPRLVAAADLRGPPSSVVGASKDRRPGADSATSVARAPAEQRRAAPRPLPPARRPSEDAPLSPVGVEDSVEELGVAMRQARLGAKQGAAQAAKKAVATVNSSKEKPSQPPPQQKKAGAGISSAKNDAGGKAKASVKFDGAQQQLKAPPVKAEAAPSIVAALKEAPVDQKKLAGAKAAAALPPAQAAISAPVKSISKDDVKKLLRFIDSQGNRNGEIDLLVFDKFIRSYRRSQGTQPRFQSGRDAVLKLEAMIDSRGMTALEWFESADNGGKTTGDNLVSDGKLTMAEIVDAIGTLNKEMKAQAKRTKEQPSVITPDEIKQFSLYLDPDGSGSITKTEFVQGFNRAKLPPNALKLESECAVIMEILFKNSENVRSSDIFRQFDKNGDMRLSPDEFTKGIEKLAGIGEPNPKRRSSTFIKKDKRASNPNPRVAVLENDVVVVEQPAPIDEEAGVYPSSAVLKAYGTPTAPPVATAATGTAVAASSAAGAPTVELPDDEIDNASAPPLAVDEPLTFAKHFTVHLSPSTPPYTISLRMNEALSIVSISGSGRLVMSAGNVKDRIVVVARAVVYDSTAFFHTSGPFNASAAGGGLAPYPGGHLYEFLVENGGGVGVGKGDEGVGLKIKFRQHFKFARGELVVRGGGRVQGDGMYDSGGGGMVLPYIHDHGNNYRQHYPQHHSPHQLPHQHNSHHQHHSQHNPHGANRPLHERHHYQNPPHDYMPPKQYYSPHADGYGSGGGDYGAPPPRHGYYEQSSPQPEMFGPPQHGYHVEGYYQRPPPDTYVSPGGRYYGGGGGGGGGQPYPAYVAHPPRSEYYYNIDPEYNTDEAYGGRMVGGEHHPPSGAKTKGAHHRHHYHRQHHHHKRSDNRDAEDETSDRGEERKGRRGGGEGGNGNDDSGGGGGNVNDEFDQEGGGDLL